MNRITHFVTSSAIAAASLTATATSTGVEINHLGTNNTLVRIVDNGPILLMPVEDSGDESKVNILVDGKIDQTIFVRLAKSKVDYHVPFDLSKYSGRNVVLDIVTSQNRSSVREASQDACWNNFSVTDTFITENREKYRPAFHHTPLYGWMNDPNGMFYKDGRWHLYYQYNPYGSKWQNMHWGHSSSTDLVHWEHHPVVISPDGLGSIFSGSCAIDHANTAGFGENAVIAMFTSAGTSQVQSLASSIDNGSTFTVYPGNPIITLESEARDPNMFFNGKTGEWNLTLAHPLEHEMLIFTSPDLKTWTLQSTFGKGEGAQGGVWECPDLFELPIENQNGATKWVLICNLNPGGPFGGSATQYFIGDFDGHKFTADTDANGQIPTKWLDYGKDHYATVSWSDAPHGRRTVIGWMSNWQYAAEVPTLQFRSANTLPREMAIFNGPDGDLYVSSTPSQELLALRDKLTIDKRAVSISQKKKTFALPTTNDGICEILLTINPGRASEITLELENTSGENTVMVFDPNAATFSFDRHNSGLTDFSQEFPAITTAPTFNNPGDPLTLRIFIDKASIEIFGNDGRFAMTNLVFPTVPYSSLSISSANGKATVRNMSVYSLKTAD